MSPPFPLSPLLVLNTLLLAACAGPAVPDTPRTAQGPGGSGSVAALESLDAAGVSALEAYAVAAPNKAFAMASDGAWGWRASTALPLEDVQQQARDNCARHGDGCTVVVTAPDVEALAALPR